MIPSVASDLDAMIAEAERQTTLVRDLLAPLSEDVARWRPAPEKWSVSGHVAHMSIVNAPYFDPMRRCAARARERGRLSDGPYRHPWFGRWFTGAMEPPPRRRVRTARAMVPDPGVNGADALADFERTQDRMIELMRDVRGVDLGRARFGSPFARIVRLSIGTGLSALLAHNRRHIWLAREVMAAPGFPGPEVPGE